MLKTKKNISDVFYGVLFVAVLLGTFVTFSKNSFAQSVVLQAPYNGTLTSPYGPRISPTAGASTNHRGQDLSGNLVSFTSTGTTLSCQNTGSAGLMAVVDHGCCVQERFMHLHSCQLGQFVTNSSGNVTGPHLHWEVIVKGVWVDPAFAMGKNLCDPNVQTQVINDAYSKLPPSVIGGGGGSTGACSAPKPQQQPVNTVTYVPPGGINPATGLPTSPTGPPIIITQTVNGAVLTTFAPRPYNPISPLTPSVTTGFTQSGPTNNPVTGCATDTWTAMVNQSVLETRREMLMNERYIAKPDSILAYSCVGDALLNAGKNVGPIFSESTLWANKQISIIGQTVTTNVSMGSGSLDGALGVSVIDLAENFIDNMFYHNYLGGTAGQTTLPPQVTGNQQGGGGFPVLQPIYNCATMANVWSMAKCGNITDPIAFPSFIDLIGNDPRKYPQLLACQDSGITQGMVDVAQDTARANISITNSHLSILNPTPAGSCAPAIPTGVTVQRQKGAAIISLTFNYEDAICPSPNCSYQNSALGGLGQCQ